MQSIGDDLAGFSLDFDPEARSLRVRGWGFWSASVGTAFGVKTQNACADVPKGSTVTMDMVELKPMREEGQLAFATLMKTLSGLGFAGISIQTGPLTKLQLLRVVRSSGAQGLVRFI